MAKKSFYDYYSEQGPTGKLIIVIAGVVGAGLVYFIGRSIVQSIAAKANLAKATADINTFNNDLNALAAQGVTPNYTASQFTQWALSLVTAYSGCDPTISALLANFSNISDASNPGNYSNAGNTTCTIFLQLKNNADFLALQVAFNIQTYPECMSFIFGSLKSVTLSQAIIDKLDGSEVTGLNTVLSNNGITYTV